MAKAKPTGAGSGATATTTTASAQAAHGQGEGRERTLAWVAHALGLFTLFLGPLAMHLLLRRRASPWLRAHLGEAVNTHVVLLAAAIVLVLALAFLASVDAAMTVIAVLLLLVVLAHVVVGVAAIVQAARGRSFHVPLGVRVVR